MLLSIILSSSYGFSVCCSFSEDVSVAPAIFDIPDDVQLRVVLDIYSFMEPNTIRLLLP